MSGYITLFGESGIRRRILALFVLHPGRRAHVRQVAREIGAAPPPVGRELQRLELAGVLTSDAVGRSRVYRLDDRSPIARDAVALFQKTEGVEALLREVIDRVPGVERAWLVGSYADRTEGADSDIDLLIVGTATQAALSEALMPVEDRISRPIHTTSMSADEFERRRHRPGFVASVLQGPRILLAGEED